MIQWGRSEVLIIYPELTITIWLFNIAMETPL